ncbi:dihydrofolate reductase [Apiospora arundinis]
MAIISGTPEYMAESRASLLIVFFALPIPIVILTTVFRLVVRLTVQKSGLTCDDHLMIGATIAAVALSAVGLSFGEHSLYPGSFRRSGNELTEFKGPSYGYGKHLEAVSPDDFKVFLMGSYVFSHFYNTAIVLTKLSVLALYNRLLATERWFKRLVKATSWTGDGSDSIRLTWFGNFTNIINLLADLWIFAMPIPVILKLQTTRNKRIGLCLVFLFGLVTCAISAARLRWVFSLQSRDVTWDMVPLGILSAWEACMGVLCGNLPVLKGFFGRRDRVPRGQSLEHIQLRRRESSQNLPADPQEPEAHTDEWTRLRVGVAGLEIV